MKGKKIFPGRYKAELPKDFDLSEMLQIEKELNGAKATIVGLFIDAVNNHDVAAIMEIARAVWFFKDHRHPHPSADRERLALLFLRDIFQEHGGSWTIREIAKFVALEDTFLGKPFEAPADGFSALRRKCKELGIPVKPSRKTTKKKGL